MKRPSRQQDYSPSAAFARLHNGRWRLLWLGQLRPSTENPTGYDIDVYFEWAAGGKKAPVTIPLPLTALPMLRLQSLWEQKALTAFGEGERLVFKVLTADARPAAPWLPGRPAEDVINQHDYRFYGLRELAPCWVFKTDDSQELVVPAWEILRAWYLFDPMVMPSVLAGLRHVEAMRRDLRPYLADTGVLEDGRPHYVVPHWMKGGSRARMARLLFDPVASDRAYDIYRQLMTPGNEGSATPLPTVLPPYDGIAQWHVLARPLTPNMQGGARWLVLQLEGATLPDTLPNVQYRDELDNRQGINRDDPSLPVRFRRRRAPVTPDSPNPLPVTGAGPDAGIESVLLEGFDFQDSIVNTLTFEKTEKPLQASRGIHGTTEPATIDGAGADPAARPRARYAPLTTANDGEEAPPKDLLERVLGVFQELIDASQRTRVEGGGWSARLLKQGGLQTICVRDASGVRRHFAVLEVAFGTRHAYLVDAQRYDREEFTLLMCRSRDYLPCALYLFQKWLERFPADKGNAWTGNEILPRGLEARRLKHQPHRRGMSTAQVDAKFAERLVRELRHFVSGA